MIWFSSTMLRRLVVVFILAGTASLGYFRKITDQGVFSLHSLTYRSDFVFLAAVVLAGALWGASLRQWRQIRLTKTERVLALSLGVYLASCIWATLFAAAAYKLWFNLQGFANLSKTLLGISLTLVTYVYLKDDAAFYKNLAWVLILPPLVPVTLGAVLLISSSTYHHAFGQLPLVSDGDRFMGLTSNPFQVSFGLLVAISFLWPMTIWEAFRGRWVHTALGLICVGGLTFGALWAMARSGVIALLFVLIFGAAAMLRYLRVKPSHYATAAGVTLLLLGGVWSVLPQDVTLALVGRFEPLRPAPALPTAEAHQAPNPIVQSAPSVSSGYGRLAIWRYFTDVALRNPLGFGFNYEQRFYFVNPYQERVPPHNNILATWMYGGLPATLGLIVFWLAVFQTIAMKLQSGLPVGIFALYLGASGAFLVMWLLSFVIGNLIGEFTYSILLAMVLAGPPRASL